MKEIVIVIVSLCIGAVIGYLYRDYRKGEKHEVIEVSATKNNSWDHVPSYINDFNWDRWTEELIWNELNEFGPV